METVDRWLKSLRLHKYTQIFRHLTYEQMLSIDEKFLIDLDITKGARNKILVSVKKLNLRHDRLANMEDDLDQDNISMKEALSLMKDMLITPIPKPLDEGLPPSPTISLPESSSTSPESSTSSSGASSTTSGFDYTDSYSMTSTGSTPNSTPTLPVDSPNTTITSSLNQDSPYTAMLAGVGGLGGKTSPANSLYTNPYELTYLFVETFEKLAQRLIDSGGFEDNACHGIMAGIVDECSKHNSFTEEQKARMARYKKPIMARGGGAGGGRSFSSQQSTTREQKYKMVGSRHQPHYPSNMRQLYQQQQQQQSRQPLPQQHQLVTQDQYYTPPPPAPRPSQNQYHFQTSHNSNPHHVVQRKNVNIYTHHSSATPYREYSLLGPGITFELPCLRAKAEAEKHNRRQFGFFTDNSSSSCSSVSSSD